MCLNSEAVLTERCPLKGKRGRQIGLFSVYPRLDSVSPVRGGEQNLGHMFYSKFLYL